MPLRSEPVPPSVRETVRRSIIALLTENALSARDISAEVRISEKEVYGHLEHIRRSLHSSGGALAVTPAACRKCGYIFSKRERLTPPGKCPLCRHQAIADPLFEIRLGARGAVGLRGGKPSS